MFLTYAELDELGYPTLSKEEFDKNIINATDAVHDLTNHFYHFKDFESDADYRKKMFKKAIAAQLNFYIEAGGNTEYMLQQPQSVNIGRTSINTGSASSTTAGGGLSSYSIEAIRHLRPTGLLYRGL